MSTQISAVPSSDPANPQGVTGKMEAIAPAIGRLELEIQKPGKTGKVGIYSSVAKSYVAIDPKSKSLKEKKIDKTCQKLFEDVVKWVHDKKDANALDIEIKIAPNHDCPQKNLVTIIYNDQRTIQYISERDIPKEFIDQMNKIRTILRPSQNVTPPKPLQLPIPDILPNSLDEFTSTHLKPLELSLAGSAKTNALQNIYASEATIRGIGNGLTELIKRKKEELDKIDALPHIPHSKKKEELDKLLELERQMQSIDRYAVYRAVSSWNNLQTGEIDDTIRFATRKTADQIGLGVKRELQEIERKRQEEHWIASNVPARLGKWYNPLESAAIHEYALDVGDLLIQDRWDYEGRRAETEQNNKTSCIEQFVVQMMMNLKTAAIQMDKHPLFESFTDETKQELLTITEHARGSGIAIHQKAAAALAPVADKDLQARLDALKDL